MASMPTTKATLYFMCGKMAAGKSTHAQALAKAKDAVILVQDELLDSLYPGQIHHIDDFVNFSDRLRRAVAPLVVDLLNRGVSVVLDFPGNTPTQRKWFRGLIECTGAAHELHYIDATDDLCKMQLKARSQGLPIGAPWTTDTEFDAVTALFQTPAAHEGFVVVRHARDKGTR